MVGAFGYRRRWNHWLASFGLAASVSLCLSCATSSPAKAQIAIYTIQELQEIGNPDKPLNGTYILANDIDATGFLFNPIGYDHPSPVSGPGFTGVFDGNGHTIKGLTISSSSSSVGLFV